jgi:ketol-acid reductoisomerase
MFYDDDADLHTLDGKTVAIIGYGSQGHAHALNLKDSGVSVVVGLRSSSASVAKAKEHGLTVLEPADAASEGDLVMLLAPDEPTARSGTGLKDASRGQHAAVRHGFSIHYGKSRRRRTSTSRRRPNAQRTRPPAVPRGLACPGSSPSPGRDGDARFALAYAGTRCTRAGVIETTFKDETETDLFGEQAVLCGGVTELVRAGYETLVDAGYDPRLAYFECLHELKLIVDLMYEKGIAGMRYSISKTAEYGDLTRGKRVIGAESRAAMKELLKEIQSDDFAREWIAENRAGQENFKRMREEQAGHQVEVVGKELRSQMDWIDTEFHE